MSFQLPAASRRLLQNVHPDLVKVVLKAAEISDIPFRVTEGLRTVERQREMVKQGVSWTMNSRHLTGHAVDIVPYVDIDGNGKVTTPEMYSWPLYHELAAIMKEAARIVGVPIEWGGDWRKNKDGPHWQLPFRQYPKSGNKVAALGAFSAEVTGDIPTDPETDNGAALKSISYAAGATLGGAQLGTEPMLSLLDGLTQQQYELSSGDVLRVIVAVGIVGIGLYLAFHKARA